MKKIDLGTFECTQDDIDSVTSALKSNMLSAGPILDKFENDVARYHNKNYGVMVNSGQSALEVAIEMTKVRLGKAVLKIALPATTYAATLWSIVRTNCVPVFVDVDESYVINYNKIDIGDDIDAILAVDLCGYISHPPI